MVICKILSPLLFYNFAKDNINEKCELADHYKSAHDNIAENQNVNKDGFETEDVEEIRNLAKYICNNK